MTCARCCRSIVSDSEAISWGCSGRYVHKECADKWRKDYGWPKLVNLHRSTEVEGCLDFLEDFDTLEAYEENLDAVKHYIHQLEIRLDSFLDSMKEAHNE